MGSWCSLWTKLWDVPYCQARLQFAIPKTSINLNLSVSSEIGRGLKWRVKVSRGAFPPATPKWLTSSSPSVSQYGRPFDLSEIIVLAFRSIQRCLSAFSTWICPGGSMSGQTYIITHPTLQESVKGKTHSTPESSPENTPRVQSRFYYYMCRKETTDSESSWIVFLMRIDETTENILDSFLRNIKFNWLLLTLKIEFNWFAGSECQFFSKKRKYRLGIHTLPYHCESEPCLALNHHHRTYF